MEFKNVKFEQDPPEFLTMKNTCMDEINDKISTRYFPDAGLKPSIDFRPVSTKYSLFPVIDRKPEIQKNEKMYLDHRVELNFNPGNRKGPFSGYKNNIEVENILRNQKTVLNKDEIGSKYIPSLKSDLYVSRSLNNHTNKNINEEDPDNSLLFRNFTFNSSPHPNVSNRIGNDIFHNNTRVQLKSSS